MQASLGVRKDAGSSFHHSVDIVQLVHTCLSFRMDRKSIFRHCSIPVKLVHTCLRIGINLESSFHHCGDLWCSYRPVWESERIQKAVFTIVEIPWSSCTYVSVSGGTLKAGFTIVKVMWKFCMPVWVSGRPWKQFSPLWKFCEACAHKFEYYERSRNQVLVLLWSRETRAGQLGCKERCWKQISPQCWYCEACWRMFEFQDGPKKHFHHCWGPVKLIHTCLRVGIYLESSFYHCGSPVKLIQVSLSVTKDS